MATLDIASLFTNVGYPIAMSVLLALYIKHQSDQMRTEREKSNEIIQGFMTTLNSYNAKLEQLTDKIDLLFQRINNGGY